MSDVEYCGYPVDNCLVGTTLRKERDELRRRLKVAVDALAYFTPSDDHLWMKRWVMYSTKREEGKLFIADMAVWLEDPKVIDAMKEQDRKLKIAEDALEWYAKSEAYADYVSKDVFGKPFVDKSTGLKARTALKQIRGDAK